MINVKNFERVVSNKSIHVYNLFRWTSSLVLLTLIAQFFVANKTALCNEAVTTVTFPPTPFRFVPAAHRNPVTQTV